MLPLSGAFCRSRLNKWRGLADEVRNGELLGKVFEDTESSWVRESSLDNFGDNGHRLNKNVCLFVVECGSIASHFDAIAVNVWCCSNNNSSSPSPSAAAAAALRLAHAAATATLRCCGSWTAPAGTHKQGNQPWLWGASFDGAFACGILCGKSVWSLSLMRQRTGCVQDHWKMDEEARWRGGGRFLDR